MNRTRRAAMTLMLGVAAAQPSQGQPAEAITIRLSNFAFTPAQLQLRVGVPVRLHLVNDSSGGNSFSAPALFAASAYPSGAPPQEGTVQVAAGGSVRAVESAKSSLYNALIGLAIVIMCKVIAGLVGNALGAPGAATTGMVVGPTTWMLGLLS